MAENLLDREKINQSGLFRIPRDGNKAVNMLMDLISFKDSKSRIVDELAKGFERNEFGIDEFRRRYDPVMNEKVAARKLVDYLENALNKLFGFSHRTEEARAMMDEMEYIHNTPYVHDFSWIENPSSEMSVSPFETAKALNMLYVARRNMEDYFIDFDKWNYTDAKPLFGEKEEARRGFEKWNDVVTQMMASGVFDDLSKSEKNKYLGKRLQIDPLVGYDINTFGNDKYYDGFSINPVIKMERK